jgi:hypothetical protein
MDGESLADRRRRRSPRRSVAVPGSVANVRERDAAFSVSSGSIRSRVICQRLEHRGLAGAPGERPDRRRTHGAISA